MPRRKSISNSKVEDFEPRKKNPLGLLDDANLDAHLKSIKIGDKLTPVKLSDNEVRFDADFSLNGKFKTHNLETDNQYMHLKVNHSVGYVVMDALYTSHVDATGNYPLNAYNVGQSGVFIDHTGGSYLGGIFTTCGNGKFTWGKTSESGGLEYQYSYNGIRLLDKTDTGDYCQLSVGTHGATTLSTVDDDATAGHLTLDADGNTIISIGDASEATKAFHITLDGATNRAFSFSGEVENYSTLRIYEQGGHTTTDYLDINVIESGETTIQTVDGAGSDANLNLDADGKIVIDSVNSAGAVTDGTLFKTSGTTFGSITTHHALSCFTLFEAAGSSTNDYFEIQVDAAGATTLTTVDAGGAGGNITLSPDGVINLTKSINITSGRKLFLDGGGDTFIVEESADLVSFYVGNSALLGLAEDATTSTAQSSKLYTGCPILLKDVGGAADTPNSGYGSIYVNSDVLYFKTDGGTETNLLAGGGGTQYWNQMVPGYTTNKTSTSNYYTFYRGWFENWSNFDSSPTTISDTDSYSTFFIAPRAGSITNIKIQGYATDTGATDTFRFYIYKGSMRADSDTISLTALFNTGAITPPSAHKTWTYTGDFSSSNTFSEDDCLYVFWKKDSNSGSQDVYWNMNISGEYS